MASSLPELVKGAQVFPSKQRSRFGLFCAIFTSLTVLFTGPTDVGAQQGGGGEIQRTQSIASETDEQRNQLSVNAAPVATSLVSDARFITRPDYTRLELDFSSEVEYSAFLLADPPRAVIDLPVVEFRLGEQDLSPSGLISNWRKGLFTPSQSRIVMDLERPALIKSARFIEAKLDRPAYLSFELEPATQEQFDAAVRDGQLNQTEQSTTSGTKGDRLPINRDEFDKYLIVLDPGHGGLDTGTVGPGGTEEKEVVLNFTLALARKLEATGDYEIQLTRDTDIFIPLSKRVQFARNKAADLFISIHADSVRQRYVRGASVYTVSQRASDEIAQELADNENRSDMLAGVPIVDEEDVVADILVDLMRRETKTFSVRFADVVVEEMRPRIKLVSNPHRYAGFRVLRAPDVPSVLVELGFLSNKEDEELLTSDAWQGKAIDSMLASIDRFFGNTNKRVLQGE